MKEYKQYITIKSICTLYKVSENMIFSMADYDLIEIVITNKVPQLSIEEIAKLESYIRLYLDLGINIEGLAVIKDLLEEREILKREIVRLSE